MEGTAQPHQLLQTPKRRGPSLQSPLSNKLVPHELLDERSSSQATRIGRSGSLRGREYTSLPSSPLPDDGPSAQIPVVSNMPSISKPHSPRPLNSNNPSPSSLKTDIHGHFNNRDNTMRKQGGKKKHVEASNISKDARASATAKPHRGSTQRSTSPPVSPGLANGTGNDRPQMAHSILPRNSSIDSAISSVSSSAEHSHKSSTESNNTTSTSDVKQLICTAGSAENLILHLLKDKRHAVSQNGQLWKLVNKQRSLLMGLNQDLERAIEDKEKYRNRFKDLQAQLRQTGPQELSNQEKSQSTRENAGKEPQLFVNSEATVQNHVSAGTLDNKSQVNSHSPPLYAPTVHSPLHPLQGRQRVEAANTVETSEGNRAGQMPTPDSDDTEGVPSPSSDERQPLDERGSPVAETNFPASPRPSHAQEIADSNSQLVGEISHSGEGDGFLARGRRQKMTVATARKPPPAPLKLLRTQPNPAVPRGSDVAGLPGLDEDKSRHVKAGEVLDRGRRKTREEDDRDREFAIQREDATRSRSGKSSKSGKHKATPESVHQASTKSTRAVANNIMPSGAVQATAGHPPGPDTNAATAPGSIAEVLSPNASGPSPITEHSIIAPPMSPGLPASPRPSDRPLGSPMPRYPRQDSGIPFSPPTSPRAADTAPPVSSNPAGVGPQAKNSQVSTLSPRTAHQAQNQPVSPATQRTRHSALPQSQAEHKVEHEWASRSASHWVHSDSDLMDPDYPTFLIAPRSLSAVNVKVSSSRLKPRRNSHVGPKPNDEDPVFTLSVLSSSSGRELWRVEKVVRALRQLEEKFKSVTNFESQAPDRKLFSGHSPAIVDARRTALDHYFRALVEAAIDEPSAVVICGFLSTDVIEARDDEPSFLAHWQRGTVALTLGTDGRPIKEGYLTKRGKNFGGWKARYFVLQGAELKYFESPAGTHLGTIKLQNARIGKQSQAPSPSRVAEDVEDQYRHAFLVLEPKRKDSSSLVRHVLCAESDQERDEWARVLTQHLDHPSDDDGPPQQSSKRPQEVKRQLGVPEAGVKEQLKSQSSGPQDAHAEDTASDDEVKGVGYDQVTAGTAPTMGNQHNPCRQETSPSPVSAPPLKSAARESHTTRDQPTAPQGSKIISGPKNGSVIQDVGSWGNRLMSTTHFKDKKRSIWGFRHWNGSDHGQVATSQNEAVQNMHQPTVRASFGLPLADAVAMCHPRGVDVLLPAVVYRCIEYLRAKDAANEEGIFRLSGSNITIRSLRTRFDTEGDVDLLADDQYYDVHAVASLFKSYLRELPTTVLTKELELDFLHVSDLGEKSKKVVACNALVHRLPQVNLALLRALSQYLIEIKNSAERNKMGVRNMGIVFSPTLNIPTGVFAMFLTEFEAIFGAEAVDSIQPNEAVAKTIDVAGSAQLSPEEIRSPRHQLFSDLPTPAHNQPSFPQGPPRAQMAMPASGAQTQPHPPWNSNLDPEPGDIPTQSSDGARGYLSDAQASNQLVE